MVWGDTGATLGNVVQARNPPSKPSKLFITTGLVPVVMKPLACGPYAAPDGHDLNPAGSRVAIVGNV
jgi:hypothetical protein